jgi:hypothetical protein
MAETTNFKFIKPDLTNAADITATNQNWDVLDDKLKELETTNEGLTTEVDTLTKTVQPITKGGTGATTKESALHNLGGLRKPTYSYVTLSASSWEGSEAPYKYNLGNTGRTVEVLEKPTMTSEQMKAIEKAKFKGDPSQAENFLYALGEKPTIDLPIILGVY